MTWCQVHIRCPFVRSVLVEFSRSCFSQETSRPYEKRSEKEEESRQSLHGHLFSQSPPRSGWVLTAGLPNQRNGNCLLCGEPSFDGLMEEAKDRYNG